MPVGLWLRVGEQIAPGIFGVRGFGVAGGDQIGGMTPEHPDGGAYVGKLLAQKILTPGFAELVHVDADDHRIAARNQKQLPVIVAWRAVKEFCEMHRFPKSQG